MHEISLVQNLLQQLQDIARDNNASRVLRVTMLIGPLSGVVVDSFTFGFDILARENDLFRDATLNIIVPPVIFRCSNCGHQKQTDGERPECCPACGDRIILAQGGDDLILQQVEME
ncbi:MAG: hydrogenase maturation nickel metallochaperone HypA [Desulfofustis sp.]|nr:hydrogenase maturation nickel metallochaperone HypA [Desulfofustis sp.]